MAYLFNSLTFEPGSRMTGLWRAQQTAASDDMAAMAHLIRLGEGQDPDIEASFLSGHLPYVAGGFYGSGPDERPWLVVLQVAPGAASALLGTDNNYWSMANAVDRALQFNPRAQARSEQGWHRCDLEEVYGRRGIDAEQVRQWSVADLLAGLLAECCYVPLQQIVAGKDEGCAFPNLVHECRGDVFADVFAVWTAAQQGAQEVVLADADDYLWGWGGPLPEYASAPIPTETLYYWPEADIGQMSTKDLRKLAARCKWGKRKTAGMKRKELLRILSTPHARNKGKGALEV